MRTFLFLAAGICVLSATGYGQAPQPSAEARQLARVSFLAAVAAFEAEQYQTALTEFERAYAAAPHPAVLVNIANCHEALQQNQEALRFYERFLVEMPTAPAAQRNEVTAAISRLRAIPTVTTSGLRVIVTGPSAPPSILVDGQMLSATDGMFQVVPGHHDVRIEAPGFVTESREIDTVLGATAELNVALHTTAMLTDPFAHDAATTPDTPARGLSMQPVTWIVAGAAGALLVGAAITGILALNANGSFEDSVLLSYRADRSQAQRLESSAQGLGHAQTARDFALVSDILWVATVLTGTAAVVLLLTVGGNEQSAPTAHVRVGLGSANISVEF